MSRIDLNELRFEKVGLLEDVVEEATVEDDGDAVIEHGFAGDLHRQRALSADLLEKADDGDGVGGGEDRSEHEARVPVPAVGEDVLGVEGGEGGSDEHTDNCEDQTLPDALLDRVPWEGKYGGKGRHEGKRNTGGREVQGGEINGGK